MNLDREFNVLCRAMQRAGLPAVTSALDAMHLNTMAPHDRIRVYDELLVMAASYGHPDIVEYVLTHGNVHSDAFHRAASMAAESRDEAVTRLLERRSSGRVRGDRGPTLH
jgi:hypothetical protein